MFESRLQASHFVFRQQVHLVDDKFRSNALELRRDEDIDR